VDAVFAGDAGIVLGRRDEFAFLQNPDRPDVVLGHEGTEWPLFDFGDECGEGSRRNAPAPELAPDPVADQPLVLGDPASDVPSHLALADDRADDVRGLAAELGPMCHEGVMIPRRKRRHSRALRVALMLEEDRKVGVDDLAQNHPWWIAHRVRRQFVVYFCRHRGKFAAKKGGASTRILRQNSHAEISVKNYMSAKASHLCSIHTTATLREAKIRRLRCGIVRHFSRAYLLFPSEEKTSAQQGDLLGYGRGAGVGRGLSDGPGRAVGDGLAVGVAVALTVAVAVAVAVAVGVGVDVAVAVGEGGTLGVGVGPSVTSRNAALIGPQVWKPWTSFTPRPRTKITWRPTDRLAVFMVASTVTVGELNVPFFGMAVPTAQGGVSM
jgi:hypothetical protein